MQESYFRGEHDNDEDGDNHQEVTVTPKTFSTSSMNEEHLTAGIKP